MTQLTQEYDTQAEVLKGQQDEIKIAIKDRMKAMGVTSVTSPEGLCPCREDSTTYTTNDWASFKDFILEHERS
jgi:hypothetical protein